MVLPPFHSTCPGEFFLRVLIRCLFGHFHVYFGTFCTKRNGWRCLLSANLRGILILHTKSYDALVFAREVEKHTDAKIWLTFERLETQACFIGVLSAFFRRRFGFDNEKLPTSHTREVMQSTDMSLTKCRE